MKQKFKKGEDSSLREGHVIQLKQLKSVHSKDNPGTLGDEPVSLRGHKSGLSEDQSPPPKSLLGAAKNKDGSLGDQSESPKACPVSSEKRPNAQPRSSKGKRKGQKGPPKDGAESSKGSTQKQTSHNSCSMGKGNSLVDRMLKNKLTPQVSAFANHKGGHIYYGVSDNGIVEGQLVAVVAKDVNRDSIQNQDEIVKMLDTEINKMIWSEGKPERGEHWEVFFEPVLDEHEEPIPCTYVIVVYVAAYCGGVFTQCPESYRIDSNGKKVKIPFGEWWREVIDEEYISPHVPAVVWHSKENEEMFCKLSEVIDKLSDANDVDGFEKFKTEAIKKFTKNNAKLIVKAGEIAGAFKQHDDKWRLFTYRVEKYVKRNQRSVNFRSRIFAACGRARTQQK